jgi:hypothetical protein
MSTSASVRLHTPPEPASADATAAPAEASTLVDAVKHAPPVATPAWWPLVRLFAMWALVWAVAGMFTQQCIKAYSLGNDLSDIADAYSEANVIKAAENYAVNGFLSNKGLAELSYGTQFDNRGGKYDKEICATPVHCVYTHYPPGAELLTGLLTKIFGVGRVLLFRAVPLSVGLFGLVFLAWALTRTIGLVRAAFVLAAFSTVPMATNMMHGLHQQGYQMSLMYVQFGLGMLVFREGLTRRRIVAMAFLGFIQGCVSFDWFFLTSLCTVPAWLMTPDWRTKPRMRQAAALVLAAGGGFAFAHFLHFLQVSWYLGGLKEALADLGHAAKHRSGDDAWPTLPVPGRFGVILYYWFGLLQEKKYLDFSFLTFVAGTLALVFPKPRFEVPLAGKKLARVVTSSSSIAFLSAIVVCSLWIVIMRAHAQVHGHFIPRHYCLTILVGLVLIARTLGWSPPARDAA